MRTVLAIVVSSILSSALTAGMLRMSSAEVLKTRALVLVDEQGNERGRFGVTAGAGDERDNPSGVSVKHLRGPRAVHVLVAVGTRQHSTTLNITRGAESVPRRA